MAVALFKHAGEKGGRVRAGCGGQLFGGSGADDAPAAVAALGAEVDDPVGGFDDIQVVLDYYHRVAMRAQTQQYGE